MAGLGSPRRSRVGIAVAAGAAAGLWRAIIVPRVDRPRHADAIVALDGDRPRRIRTAVALAVAGYAPILVVVRGDESAPELLGETPLPFEVLSFAPDPPTTRGEARGLARLAKEHGWSSLVVVTSTFHITRARLILRRALDLHLSFVGAGMRGRRAPIYVGSETAKLLLALTLRRSP